MNDAVVYFIFLGLFVAIVAIVTGIINGKREQRLADKHRKQIEGEHIESQ